MVAKKIGLFGGVYNNYLALETLIDDASRRGLDKLYCLGDLGAFGPYPDRVFPLLIDHDIDVIQGNYDDSIGRGLSHCQCGYTDPADNRFAALSYAYTFAKTDKKWRPWLAKRPKCLRLDVDDMRVVLCHGSPRRTNEFLWESTTSTAFLDRLCREYQADVIATTHTGIKWKRDLVGDRLCVNVGVIGRPENDGTTRVWYTVLSIEGRRAEIEFVPLAYDHERLASEMRDERIPEEFITAITTGWWTTCLEILPAKERRRGIH